MALQAVIVLRCNTLFVSFTLFLISPTRDMFVMPLLRWHMLGPGLLTPAIFHSIVNLQALNVEHKLSVGVSTMLLICYLMTLWFQLVTHRHLFEEEERETTQLAALEVQKEKALMERVEQTAYDKRVASELEKRRKTARSGQLQREFDEVKERIAVEEALRLDKRRTTKRPNVCSWLAISCVLACAAIFTTASR